MQNNSNVTQREIVFADLSYQVMGAAFRVFNNVGWGLPEKYYQAALAKELETIQVPYKKEVYIPLKYQFMKIGRYFADFVIDDKILLELKVVRKLGYAHTKQMLNYLRSSGLKLGILLYFSPDGVKYRRVLNSHYLETN